MADMASIPSPYGFVPLSRRVFFPEWGQVPAWDVPFEDGVCGSLTLDIEALTPIFVRGASERALERERFFRTPDGGTAIPGSEIRGMLRNVLEIATLGKISRINDHRYGVRDLQNPELYSRHMADILRMPDGRQSPLPLVDAGWLELAPGGSDDDDTPEDAVVARIQPCDFAKIEYRLLLDLADERHIRGFDPGRRQGSPDKYRSWGRELGVRVQVRELRPPQGRVLTSFGEVTDVGGGCSDEGTLVFTGQPNQWRRDQPRGGRRGNPKHHDFVFLSRPTTRNPVNVTRKALRDFEFVHRGSGQQHRLTDEIEPNAEWGYWKATFKHFGRVPVFFLMKEDNEELRAFGLALMFRLAYKHSTREAAERGQPDIDDPRFDFAETLFGTVRRQDRKAGEHAETEARRGRVSFSLALAQGSAAELEPRTEVLGAPKASYYPSYVEQGRGPGEAPAIRSQAHGRSTVYAWQTFMDDDARIRGWKRYRPQEVRHGHVPTRGDGRPMDLARIGSTFRPVKQGARFRCTVRLHNLKKVELGALAWIFDFGGKGDECFHALGMARPLGYGRVRLRVLDEKLRDMAGGPVSLPECREAFVRSMEDECRKLGMSEGWLESAQIQELVALARPLPAGSNEGRYMLIRNDDGENEYVEAKKAGLALRMASRPQGRASGGPSAPPRSGVPAHGAPPSRPVNQPRGVGTLPHGPRGGMPPDRRRDAPPAPRRGSWTPLKVGAVVKGRIVGKSKKDKWQVELVDYPNSKGTIVEGKEPADVAPGKEFQLVVKSGATPDNVVLGWS